MTREQLEENLAEAKREIARLKYALSCTRCSEAWRRKQPLWPDPPPAKPWPNEDDVARRRSAIFKHNLRAESLKPSGGRVISFARPPTMPWTG